MSEENKFTYSASLPYPEIKIKKHDQHYGKWMLDNMGANSEMSAVSMYFYNNLVITGEKHKEIAVVYHKISIVEMHHLSLFGNLALALGEDPRLWTYQRSTKKYWTPAYNHYCMGLNHLLHNSLKGELEAIKKYEEQICHTKEECIINMLRRIIMDEQMHVDIFERLIKKYC